MDALDAPVAPVHVANIEYRAAQVGIDPHGAVHVDQRGINHGLYLGQQLRHLRMDRGADLGGIWFHTASPSSCSRVCVRCSITTGPIISTPRVTSAHTAAQAASKRSSPTFGSAILKL